MRILLPLALLFVSLGAAQEKPAAPAFDVTSVKPNPGGRQDVQFDPQPGGRLRIINASLRMVMGWAYGVQDVQLSGGPDWMGTARFDFLAKAEGNPTTAQMRTMLRGLLVHHFKLAFHNETRELPVYALTRLRADRLGPQLVVSADTKCGAPADADAGSRRCEFDVRWAKVHGHGIPIELLVTTLSGFTARPVVDRTGLTVPLDFDLTWTGPDGEGPSLFTAVEEQLGLKLEPTRAPLGIMVIDRAEKPTED